jgi:hypothetical protein
VTIGGVVVDTVWRGRPGPRLGAVVGSWAGLVVTVLGFVGDDGMVLLMEALWAAAMRCRQRMRLRDPVGRALARGALMFMVAVGELGRQGSGGRGLRIAV